MESFEKRYKRLHEDLIYADSSKKVTIIKNLRNEKVFPGVILLLKDIMEESDNDLLITEISNFLGDIKDQNLTAEVIEAIDRAKTDIVQQILIGSCWQSGLDYTEYLDRFIDYSINLSYLATLECYSVIEEWAINADKESKTKWIQALQLSLPDHNSEKKSLIEAIISLL